MFTPGSFIVVACRLALVCLWEIRTFVKMLGALLVALWLLVDLETDE